MIETVVCIAVFSVIQIIINIHGLKKLGKSEYCFDSIMSKKEMFSLVFRGSSTVILALLFDISNLIKETMNKSIISCLMGIYCAYVIYPLINYFLFKKKIGLYENGVMTYGGFMKYSFMKEYMIKENENHDNSKQNITVYCKSNLSILSSAKHFDVNEESAEKINYYFKKKHTDIIKTAKMNRKV